MPVAVEGASNNVYRFPVIGGYVNVSTELEMCVVIRISKKVLGIIQQVGRALDEVGFVRGARAFQEGGGYGGVGQNVVKLDGEVVPCAKSDVEGARSRLFFCHAAHVARQRDVLSAGEVDGHGDAPAVAAQGRVLRGWSRWR